MFLFKYKKVVSNHNSNLENAVWNTKLQIWIDKTKDMPLVSLYMLNRSSDYGETILTETNEGVDQSEVITNTRFGETVITNTVEGIDQSETSLGSVYGETILTKTHEGVDQSEGSQSIDIPYLEDEMKCC